MISTANNRKEKQMRNKHHINNDDYEVINGRKVLKDGRRYHAGSVLLMDSATPRHPGFPRVKTADGNDLSFHKPGWRLAATHDADLAEFSYGVTAADRQAIIDARQQYEDELTSAWQHDARRKVQARNAKGQESGTYEEEEEDGS
jgi:hypothetical protein